MLSYSIKSIKTKSLQDFQLEVREKLAAQFHFFQNSEQQMLAWDISSKWIWDATQDLEANSDLLRVVFELTPPLSLERPDITVIGEKVVLVIEAKTGTTETVNAALKQVVRYARNIYNYADVGRKYAIFPVLLREGAKGILPAELHENEPTTDRVVDIPPSKLRDLISVIDAPLDFNTSDPSTWLYHPRPSIVDAARVMFSQTTDQGILESLADDDELSALVNSCTEQIRFAKENKKRLVLAVSGVPGAGKTLVGLRLANSSIIHELCSDTDTSPPLYLSGNGPLVDVLTEALVRDERLRTKCSREIAEDRAKAKIRLIHGLTENKFAVTTHVLIFDEAQRAWDEQRMRTKTGQHDLGSEAEEVLRRVERDVDWSVVICLVGTGQQINDGERGMSTWTDAIKTRAAAGADWELHGSAKIAAEDGADLDVIVDHPELHLKVVRRANDASVLGDWVSALLNDEIEEASALRKEFKDFPIFVTRDLNVAKSWLKDPSRPKYETFGLLASSKSARLSIYGVDAQASAGSTHDWTQWFLDTPPNLNSAMNLEVAATEFKCQGLELDRTGVCWSWDLIHKDGGWVTRKIQKRNSQWSINKSRREFAINSYRVLLTRARAGMIIWVPEGSADDPSRKPSEVDATFKILVAAGCTPLDGFKSN